MLYAIVAVLALILDQAVKYWTTVNIIVDTGEAKLIPGFIHIANVHNTGAAFSFLEGARWFFVILCILFCLLVIYVLVKNIITNRAARWMAVLVMAGAIGNCIDRIVCGYVVDMFEFEFRIFGKQFPVFNLADIYITLGAIIFCICILRDKPKTAQKNVPYAEASAAEEKRAAKPLFARRQRTPIPDFPKREHTPAQTSVDPEDPFAEWERRAEHSGSTVYTQPAAAAAEARRPVVQQPAPAPAETPRAAAPQPVPVKAEEPRPTAPQPAAPKADADSFNLDDILAEFRDL